MPKSENIQDSDNVTNVESTAEKLEDLDDFTWYYRITPKFNSDLATIKSEFLQKMRDTCLKYGMECNDYEIKYLGEVIEDNLPYFYRKY